MQLNPLKTKGMLFNPLHKWDFQPQLTTNGSDPIEIVEEYKILGYVMRSDLKTTSNTDYICQRAYKRMWILRRLKSLGCPTEKTARYPQTTSYIYFGGRCSILGPNDKQSGEQSA